MNLDYLDWEANPGGVLVTLALAVLLAAFGLAFVGAATQDTKPVEHPCHQTTP